MLTPTAEGIEVKTPYAPAFVADFKSRIPASERRWGPDRKVWIVAHKHGAIVASLIKQYFGTTVTVPFATVTEKTETKLLQVEYLGRCKDRGSDARSAFGYVDGDWSTIFPENVLKNWFCAIDAPGDHATLYAVLGVPRSAEPAIIKKAYRRLVRQWHPDVCHEPDAGEQFRAVQEAYELLRDPGSRARYDAGLALEASLKQQAKMPDMDGYRSPLRCGFILAEGSDIIGRFVVSRILQWEDIRNSQGQVLVVSWPFGADIFEKRWT